MAVFPSPLPEPIGPIQLQLPKDGPLFAGQPSACARIIKCPPQRSHALEVRMLHRNSIVRHFRSIYIVINRPGLQGAVSCGESRRGEHYRWSGYQQCAKIEHTSQKVMPLAKSPRTAPGHKGSTNRNKRHCCIRPRRRALGVPRSRWLRLARTDEAFPASITCFLRRP
jgi:hypothetical protein